MENLKISMNVKKITSAYGGGNKFANILGDYLKDKGHSSFRRLVPNLDIMLIVSSKDNLNITSYTIDEIKDYIALHPNTVVVHRVNTCDEGRGSDLGNNQAIVKANQIADYTVFISSFLKDLYGEQGIDISTNSKVILNGADEKVFNPSGKAKWKSGEKLKIVTHHWSSNFMKGFDIYERLDQLLEREPFKSKFDFTYIGNKPLGVRFSNTKVLKPLNGEVLAKQLKKNHVYITAARNEGAGMHHIEGMRCGLPVLYLRTGALPEYCFPYGIEFTLINFEDKLLEMYKRYSELREKVLECPYSGKRMARKYEELFHQLIDERHANPLKKLGLGTVLKSYLITKPFRKMKKFRKLIYKVFRHLR